MTTAKKQDSFFNFENATVIILAPHTDDGEFGCGGTISKIKSRGGRIIYIAFSAAEQSVPPHLPRDILRTEVLAATAQLGIPRNDCLVLDFEVRNFHAKRQEILEQMVQLNATYHPNMVLLPSSMDTHQDHYVISQEGFRAFKRCTMLGYEIPWNNLSFETSCFVALDECHIATKVAALKCYESQRGRSYASEEFIRSLALTRGTQIGKRYAEAFEVIRLIIDR